MALNHWPKTPWEEHGYPTPPIQNSNNNMNVISEMNEMKQTIQTLKQKVQELETKITCVVYARVKNMDGVRAWTMFITNMEKMSKEDQERVIEARDMVIPYDSIIKLFQPHFQGTYFDGQPCIWARTIVVHNSEKPVVVELYVPVTIAGVMQFDQYRIFDALPPAQLETHSQYNIYAKKPIVHQ